MKKEGFEVTAGGVGTLGSVVRPRSSFIRVKGTSETGQLGKIFNSI